MGLLFAAFFGVHLFIVIAIRGAESNAKISGNQTPFYYNCDKTMVCTSIKTLETKVDNLIALVKKLSKPSPTPTPTPGKLGLSQVIPTFYWSFVQERFLRSFLSIALRIYDP